MDLKNVKGTRVALASVPERRTDTAVSLKLMSISPDTSIEFRPIEAMELLTSERPSRGFTSSMREVAGSTIGGECVLESAEDNKLLLPPPLPRKPLSALSNIDPDDFSLLIAAAVGFDLPAAMASSIFLICRCAVRVFPTVKGAEHTVALQI